MRGVITNGTPRMPGFKYTYDAEPDRRHRGLLVKMPEPGHQTSRRRSQPHECTARSTISNEENAMTNARTLHRCQPDRHRSGARRAVPCAGAALADALLTGAITSAAGEKMGGVTVSAKAEGSTITTSVYTDESRQLLFPAAARGQIPGVGAGAQIPDRQGQCRARRKTTHQDFALQPMPTRRTGSGSCPATSSSPRCPATRRTTSA